MGIFLKDKYFTKGGVFYMKKLRIFMTRSRGKIVENIIYD